jgi:hypothetical protein
MGWALSSAPDTNSGTPAVVAHNENSDQIADATKQEMIREALQVHAADIAFANREGFGPIRSLVHVVPKLRIKFIGKLSCPNPLVVPHDLRRYPNRPSDGGRAASGSTALNLVINLFQRQAAGRIRFELRIAPKRLRDALVRVVKNRW